MNKTLAAAVIIIAALPLVGCAGPKIIALRTKPGVGQEIVRPAEQTAWAMEDARSVITSEIEKARDRVSNINLEQLSDGEKAENRDAIAKLSFFRQNRLKEI